MSFPPRDQITGLVLAGGRGQRLDGEDKGLLPVGNRRMIEHVAARLEPQVDEILISANRNIDEYRTLGYRVVADTSPDFPGPLAGIARGLAAARTPYVAIVPCDAPSFPGDLVARLRAALVQQGRDAAAVHDGERLQPLFALLSRSLLTSLESAMADGERRVQSWLEDLKIATVSFADCPHAFLNINDRSTYEKFLHSTTNTAH